MNTDKLQLANYINGKWVATQDDGALEVFDKYTQASLCKLPLAGDSDVELAVSSAVAGFKILKSWSAGKRSEYLKKLYSALEKRREEAVEIIISEAGKPRSYAESEVTRCLSTIESAIEQAKSFVGETVPIDFGAGEGKTAFTKRFPIGPVLCITPFNFPLNLVLHKVAPALACGCSVIVKPAPQSPLSSLFLASLLEQAGYPAGVANFLLCSIPLAEKMVRDERIAMISFTGSEKVGWYLKSICGMKKVALELGGNAAVIIDESTDIAAIAKSVAMGAYLYSGQICISTQRVFVIKSVFEDFKKLLVAEIAAIKVGDPKDKSTISGPLIDKLHLNRINDWVKEAKSLGAQVLIGGEVGDEKANIFQPTLLTNTCSPMKVVDEEAFGPIAILESVDSFQAAMDLVNSSKFGLQVGVFTNNFAHVKAAHEELEVGAVIINNIPGFRIDSMPYGGIKMSGLGREGIRYTMEEMTEPRLIVY